MRVHIEASLIGLRLRGKKSDELQELKDAIVALLDRMIANAGAAPGVHQLVGSEGMAFGSVTFHAGIGARPVVSMVHTADIDKAIAIVDGVEARLKRSASSATQANELSKAAKVLRGML